MYLVSNNMKPCKLIIFLLPLVGFVSGYCNQYSELRRVRQQIEECESDESPFHAFRLLNQMSSETLTIEQFAEELYSFCSKIPSKTLACLSQNVNVREDCLEIDEIQSSLNFKVLSWYSTNILCENNATRYLDIAADDGPTCFTNNNSFGQCLSQPKYNRNAFNMAPYSNRDVCGSFDQTNDCLSSYDSCENQNVRIHMQYVNQQLQHRFGCVNTK